MLEGPIPVVQPPGLLKRLVGALQRPPPVRAFSEMGVSGTAVHAGYVQSREKSPEWSGSQRYVTIADMAVNASIVAAGVHYFLNLIAHPAWSVVPADESDEARAAAELVEDAIHDMDQPWSRVVRRAGTYRFYGFGVQEWTAKRRADGRIGLRSIEPRPQYTVERWTVADDGSVEGAWQRSPKDGELLGIPRRKFLYLVDDTLTDSPEGIGIFRHLADPWRRLKEYYDLEARAFERDLRGIPIGRAPYGLINRMVDEGKITPEQAATLVKGLKDFVQAAVKRSDTGLMLDSTPYESQAADGRKIASVMQWGLELLQGSANGVAELGAAIVRTQHEMARVLTAEHLLMGEASGNRSLGEDKSRNLYLVANSVLDSDVRSGVEHDVVAPLCDLNGVPEELRPGLEVEDVAFKDVEAVASVLQKMAQAGAMLAPDDPVIEDVRGLMGVSAPAAVSPELVGVTTGGEDDELDEGEPEPGAGAEEGEDFEMRLGKGALRTLFVRRRLLNAEDVRRWAAAQGIASTLPPDDMHVTVAFSREPVDWSRLTPDPHRMTVVGGDRLAHQFPPRTTPNGALVLRFTSGTLERRHQEFLDAGASWDFPQYLPHITLTYSVAAADLAGMEPYTGPLAFGPEEFDEVSDDWASSIDEVATADERSAPRGRRK